MTHDSAQHHRRSIRLRGYDYSQPAAYFVTIVTQLRRCLYGEIVNETMLLNAAGQMVAKWWLELAHKFPGIELDVFAVMPNHVHGIVVIKEVERAIPNLVPHTNESLPVVVQWFKTMTTNEYARGVKKGVWPPFAGRLWQRNYYEHIVRNLEELQNIRLYIENNPAQWALDAENPARSRP